MLPSEHELILERLTRLERQNLLHRTMAIVAALGLIVTVVFGQGSVGVPKTTFTQPPAAAPTAPKIIEAQGFVVKDEQGRMRAKLATSVYGTVLSFYEEQLPEGVVEQKFVELGVMGDRKQAILNMYDPSSKAGVVIAVASQVGGATLVLKSAQEEKRLDLIATHDIGGPKIVMTYPKGLERVLLDGEPDTPSLELKPLRGEILKLRPSAGPR